MPLLTRQNCKDWTRDRMTISNLPNSRGLEKTLNEIAIQQMRILTGVEGRKYLK